MEIYGRDGALVVESPRAPAAQRHAPPRRQGLSEGAGGAAGRPRQQVGAPNRCPQGPPLNVAQMWSRFATAVRAGEDVEPDFAHAVERHRLLDAIQRASATGERQAV